MSHSVSCKPGGGGTEIRRSSSCSTPATTARASPISSPTCRSRSWCGCVRIVCSLARLGRTCSARRRATGQARQRVRVRRPGHLGQRGRGDQHRHSPLRGGDRAGMGSVASPADPPLGLVASRWAATDHRGHRDPADRRAPSQRRGDKPVWLWWSHIDATVGDIDRCWRMFLRRFDIEHTLRCSNRLSAGPGRCCATPQPLDLADPDRLHPATPAPGPSPPTYACPGRNPPHRTSSPPRGSDAGFETSAPRQALPPLHRNPPAPVVIMWFTIGQGWSGRLRWFRGY